MSTIAQRPKQPTKPPLIKRLEAAKHADNEQSSASSTEASYHLKSATTLLLPNSKASQHICTAPTKTANAPSRDHSTDTLEQRQVPEHLDSQPDTVPNLAPVHTSSQHSDVTLEDIPATAADHHIVVEHSVLSNEQVEAQPSPQFSTTTQDTDIHKEETPHEKRENRESTYTTYKTQDFRTAPNAVPVDDGKSSDYNEMAFDHDMSYETSGDSGSQVFEELFGSSGGEEDDEVSDDMELLGSEMEQRRAEEEFRRLTTQSADLSHVPVSSILACTYSAFSIVVDVDVCVSIKYWCSLHGNVVLFDLNVHVHIAITGVIVLSITSYCNNVQCVLF